MRRVGLWAILSTVGLIFVGGLFAFVLLPQSQESFSSTWAAWCSALGVPGKWLSGSAPLLASSPSRVVLTHELLSPAGASEIGQGATLALRCTMCHGPTGLSFANSPNLAGQYAVVVYKQLQDYKSGARTSAIMTAMAASLSDADMRQLAYYYASLPKPQVAQLRGSAPAIVKWGAPARNVAPCGSCHGDLDHTLGSPWIKGEPKVYILTQLQAFAHGQRTNDINGQMRAMARGLTMEEIEQSAAYYAGDIR